MSRSRFPSAVLVAAALLTSSVSGRAQSPQARTPPTYSAEAFKAAISAGKTVMVAFHAPWCPVCRAQEPKVEALLGTEYRDVVAFNVDYDTNVPLRKEMGVLRQATLILFKGSKEIARLEFKSDDASLREFFSHAHPQ